jgi:hypothetical protein
MYSNSYYIWIWVVKNKWFSLIGKEEATTEIVPLR